MKHNKAPKIYVRLYRCVQTGWQCAIFGSDAFLFLFFSFLLIECESFVFFGEPGQSLSLVVHRGVLLVECAEKTRVSRTQRESRSKIRESLFLLLAIRKQADRSRLALSAARTTRRFFLSIISTNYLHARPRSPRSPIYTRIYIYIRRDTILQRKLASVG